MKRVLRVSPRRTGAHQSCSRFAAVHTNPLNGNHTDRKKRLGRGGRSGRGALHSAHALTWDNGRRESLQSANSPLSRMAFYLQISVKRMPTLDDSTEVELCGPLRSRSPLTTSSARAQGEPSRPARRHPLRDRGREGREGGGGVGRSAVQLYSEQALCRSQRVTLQASQCTHFCESVLSGDSSLPSALSWLTTKRHTVTLRRLCQHRGHR